jgi:hypothetical protein
MFECERFKRSRLWGRRGRADAFAVESTMFMKVWLHCVLVANHAATVVEVPGHILLMFVMFASRQAGNNGVLLARSLNMEKICIYSRSMLRVIRRGALMACAKSHLQRDFANQYNNMSEGSSGGHH